MRRLLTSPGGGPPARRLGHLLLAPEGGPPARRLAAPSFSARRRPAGPWAGGAFCRCREATRRPDDSRCLLPVLGAARRPEGWRCLLPSPGGGPPAIRLAPPSVAARLRPAGPMAPLSDARGRPTGPMAGSSFCRHLVTARRLASAIARRRPDSCNAFCLRPETATSDGRGRLLPAPGGSPLARRLMAPSAGAR